jgi:hypothetical protein
MLVEAQGTWRTPADNPHVGALVKVRGTGVALVAAFGLIGCGGSAPTQGEHLPAPVVTPVASVVTPGPALSRPPSPAAAPTLSARQLIDQALAALGPDRSYPPFIVPLPPIPPRGYHSDTAPTELSGAGSDDTGVAVGEGTWRVSWLASFPSSTDVVVPTCDFEITVFDAAGTVVGSALVTIDVDEDAGTSFAVPVARRQELTVLIGGDCAWQWSVESQ